MNINKYLFKIKMYLFSIFFFIRLIVWNDNTYIEISRLLATVTRFFAKVTHLLAKEWRLFAKKTLRKWAQWFSWYEDHIQYAEKLFIVDNKIILKYIHRYSKVRNCHCLTFYYFLKKHLGFKMAFHLAIREIFVQI